MRDGPSASLSIRYIFEGVEIVISDSIRTVLSSLTMIRIPEGGILRTFEMPLMYSATLLDS
jgi:hypothetical protein